MRYERGGEDGVEMDAFQNKVTQDINELKHGQNRLVADSSQVKDDVRDLQISDKLQDQEIAGIKASLSEIREDTNWIRRRITGSVITAIITAVIGGIVGIAVVFIYG